MTSRERERGRTDNEYKDFFEGIWVQGNLWQQLCDKHMEQTASVLCWDCLSGMDLSSAVRWIYWKQRRGKRKWRTRFGYQEQWCREGRAVGAGLWEDLELHCPPPTYHTPPRWAIPHVLTTTHTTSAEYPWLSQQFLQSCARHWSGGKAFWTVVKTLSHKSSLTRGAWSLGNLCADR